MAPNDNPPFKAERTLLGVAIEGDQKTEVVPERFPGFTSGSVSATDPEIDWQELRAVGGDREAINEAEGQYQFSGGSWTLNPYDGWPIAFVLGAESVAADTPNTGLTQHTLTAKQDGPPVTATAEYVYLSGDSAQSDFVRPYLGVFATSGEISQNNEGLMEVSVENEALGMPDEIYSSGARTTYTTDTSWLPTGRKPWKFQDADSQLTLFGTSFARVQDFTLQTETGSEASWYVEGTHGPEPYEATYGNAEHSLDATITVSDASLFNELVSQGASGFDATISFAKQFTPEETLDINCSGCRIESAPHDIPEDGTIDVDVTMSVRNLEVVVVDSQTAGTGYLSAGTVA